MIPKKLEKIDRSQFITFLDTTPGESTPTWAVLGIGITDYSIDFNPQVETEKWIIERNARTDHTSNQKQSSVSQKAYKGDPCFEFVHKGIDKLNYKTHILDIDRWNGAEGSYPAKMSDGVIVVTSYMGETAGIEYDLYYDGDTIEGTVSIDEAGIPTFTPNK